MLEMFSILIGAMVTLVHRFSKSNTVHLKSVYFTVCKLNPNKEIHIYFLKDAEEEINAI